MHRRDGSTIVFSPSKNGLYKHELTDNESVNEMWTMLEYVGDKAKNYTKRAYKRALMARKFQNIIMRPSSRKYKDVVINHLRGCPVTKADIQAAEDIFGPNLGSLKGKTVRRPNEHIRAGIAAVPSDVIELYSQVTIAIDIMFVNKVAFFITISRDLKFGTVESLTNRKVLTIRDCLKKVVTLYQSRGFTVGSIMADSEFEALRPWYPTLNTAAADEHVAEVERYIRTIKDSTRSAYSLLPFRHVPRIVLIHLVKNAVFWRNAFLTDDGITRMYSPRYILTGQELDAT